MNSPSHTWKALSIALAVSLLLPILPPPPLAAAPEVPETAMSSTVRPTAPDLAPSAAPHPPEPRLALSVRLSPEEALPGEPVDVAVRLINTGDAPATSVALSGTLPLDLECPRCRGFFNPLTRRFLWRLPALDAGQEISHTFAVRVQALAGWEEGTALSLEARGADTPVSFASDVVRVPYPLADGPVVASIPEGTSGQIVSADGRVTVTFPAEVVTSTLTVAYTPTSPISDTHRQPLRRFEVKVYDSSGREIHQFAAPIEIAYRYTWGESLGRNPAGFFLARYDESTGLWQRLPTEVDEERRHVIGQTTHFSEITLEDDYFQLPSDDYLPAVQGFQEIDLFSGAASYSYPIQVPPGRAGFSPRLSLSYSSGSSDWPARPWDPDVQADWVGYGWSLGVGYVGRQNVGGYIFDRDSCQKTGSNFNRTDAFNLVLNGAGHDLVWRDQDGRYRTMAESFWRISHPNQDEWQVVTRDGTTYTFAQTLWQVKDGEHQIYRWLLTQAEDLDGNRIEYSYTTQEVVCPFNLTCHEAAYLSEIRYNFETIPGQGEIPLTRISFELGTRRDDYYASHDDSRCPAELIQDWKLDAIHEWVWVEGSYQLVRSYLFSYGYSTFDDADDDVWQAKLTLASVAQCADGEGANCLPATSFDYYPMYVNSPQGGELELQVGRNRLRRVENGYGGTAEFGYENVPEEAIGPAWVYRNRVITRTVSDGLGHDYTWTYGYEGAARNTPEGPQCADPGNSEDAYQPRPRTRVEQQFRGHITVTVTAPDGHVEIHTFAQDDVFRGRELVTEYRDATLLHSLMRRVDRTHAYQEFWVNPDSIDYDFAAPEIAFAYLSEEENCTTQWDGGASCSTTVYRYEEDYQGGTQYGNQTHVEEYGAGTPGQNPPIRTTLRGYYPNPTAWIVSLAGYENVYAGWGEPECGGSCDWERSTYYGYDGQNPFIAPTLGQLTRVFRVLELDGDGMATTAETAYGYDSYGNRSSETSYNVYGYCSSEQGGPCYPASQEARTTFIDYDHSSQGYHLYPERVTYPLAALVETATYDYRLGVLESHSDLNGEVTGYGYDPFGRVTSVWRPGDSQQYPTTRVQYEHFGTAGVQRVIVYQREESGASGGEIWEERFFDGLGRTVQVHNRDEGDGHLDREVRTSTSYDAFGRVEYEWVPYYADHGEDGGYGEYSYVPPDPNGPRTCYSYDSLGRVREVLNPDGTVVSTHYSGWQTAVLDENQQLVVRENDALGRLVRVEEYDESLGGFPWDPNWGTLPPPYATSQYGYDVADQLIATTDELGNVTTISYDHLGRRTTRDDPDMGVWTYAYDPLGNLTAQTDARGQVVSFEYDQMNRVTLKDLPGSSSDVHYQYDNALGDADTANSWGRLRRAYLDSLPASNLRAYKYDARGQVIWDRVKVAGVNYDTAYEYDAMDRVVRTTYPDGEQVVQTYGTHGLLIGVQGDTTYVSSIEYNALRENEQLGLGQAVYNPILVVNPEYYPWQEYGGRGRLESLHVGPPDADPEHPEEFLQYLGYSYDAGGNVNTITDSRQSPAQVQSFSYDVLDRLTGALVSGGNEPAYSEEYNYDEIGNITDRNGLVYTYDDDRPHAVRRVNGTGGETKTVTIWAKGSYGCGGYPVMQLYVDGEYRTEWTVNSAVFSEYTANTTLSGNDQIDVVFNNNCMNPGDRDLWVDRIVVDGQTIYSDEGAAIVDWGSGSAAFDGHDVEVGQEWLRINAALRFVVGEGGFAGGYDENGNLTSLVRDGTGYILTYDAENRITAVEDSNGTVASFVYGPEGERVQGTVDGVTTTYVGDHYEIHGDSGPVVKYYYANGQRVAMREGGTLYWLLSDHLGSTSVTANAAGTMVAELRYLPFGETRYSNGTTPTTFRFTGQRQEEDLGLYYFRARWYDPHLGRFIQPDTIVPEPGDPQSWNRYSYVRNRPLVATDPTGHRDCGPGCDEEVDSPSRSKNPSEEDRDLEAYDAYWNAYGWYMDRDSPHFLAFAELWHLYYSAHPGEWVHDVTADVDNMAFRAIAAEYYALEVLEGFWVPGAQIAAPAIYMGTVQAAYQGVEFGYNAIGAGSSGAAHSAVSRVMLGRQLASEQQMGEPGTPILGTGTNRALLAAPRLAATYGGNPGDWAKMTSSSYINVDGTQFQTHWYQNMATGGRFEFKTIIELMLR